MTSGGWGWVFRVYRLNSREAARRPLPFDILKRATRRRPKKNGNTLEKFSRHLAKIYYDMSMQIIIANERTNLQHDTRSQVIPGMLVSNIRRGTI